MRCEHRPSGVGDLWAILARGGSVKHSLGQLWFKCSDLTNRAGQLVALRSGPAEQDVEAPAISQDNLPPAGVLDLIDHQHLIAVVNHIQQLIRIRIASAARVGGHDRVVGAARGHLAMGRLTWQPTGLDDRQSSDHQRRGPQCSGRIADALMTTHGVRAQMVLAAGSGPPAHQPGRIGGKIPVADSVNSLVALAVGHGNQFLVGRVNDVYD